MKLFLVRHAQAVTGSPDDPTRSLTDMGFAQAEKVANWLSEELPEGQPVRLLSSSYLRAWQTAEAISKSIGQEIELMTSLQPDADPKTIIETLTPQIGVNLVLVTHLPLVGRLASLLIDGQVCEQPWSLAEAWELEGDIVAAGCMQNSAVWYPVLDE